MFSFSTFKFHIFVCSLGFLLILICLEFQLLMRISLAFYIILHFLIKFSLFLAISLQKVTPWNVVKLRDAIINGPEIHPGATHYVDKLSTVKLAVNKKMRISISRKLPSSRGVVAQPGRSSDNEFEGKIVYRHLQDGDIVLVNRQVLHIPI